MEAKHPDVDRPALGGRRSLTALHVDLRSEGRGSEYRLVTFDCGVSGSTTCQGCKPPVQEIDDIFSHNAIEERVLERPLSSAMLSHAGFTRYFPAICQKKIFFFFVKSLNISSESQKFEL